MRLLLCLPLAVVATGCSLTVSIDLTRQQTAPTSATVSRTAPDGTLTRLIADYEAELAKQCGLRLISDESCGELRRRVMVLQQVQEADRSEAYHALNHYTGEVEDPNARRSLLGLLGRIGLALARRSRD
jgi:hypothetical protein